MNVRALYELKRQGLLIGYIQNADRFDDAFAFAYQHRLAPISHHETMRESYDGDPFVHAYVATADVVSEVVRFIHECWSNKTLDEINFRNQKDRSRGNVEMMELKHIIKYSQIPGRFDGAVYPAIKQNAPLEACSLDGSFSRSNVHCG